MAFIAHTVFSKAAQYQEKSEPHDIVSRVQGGSEISLPEAARLMDWLIYELRTVLKANEAAVTKADIDITMHPLTRRCGFSQDVATMALGDRGIDLKRGDTQFLSGYAAGHAFATLEVKTTAGPILYLLDPTFRQFCLEDVPEIDKLPAPGHWLAGEGAEPAFVETLLEKGYAVVTPELAEKYVTSMCGGYPPFENASGAFDFMRDPPQPEFDARSIYYYPAVRKAGHVF